MVSRISQAPGVVFMETAKGLQRVLEDYQGLKSLMKTTTIHCLKTENFSTRTSRLDIQNMFWKSRNSLKSLSPQISVSTSLILVQDVLTEIWGWRQQRDCKGCWKRCKMEQ